VVKAPPPRPPASSGAAALAPANVRWNFACGTALLGAPFARLCGWLEGCPAVPSGAVSRRWFQARKKSPGARAACPHPLIQPRPQHSKHNRSPWRGLGAAHGGPPRRLLLVLPHVERTTEDFKIRVSEKSITLPHICRPWQASTLGRGAPVCAGVRAIKPFLHFK